VAIRVDLNNLPSALVAELMAWEKHTTDIIDNVCEEVAEELAKDLSKNSPKDTGKYAKDWKVKRIKFCAFKVYNYKHYRLTHLLELGHAKLNGGRTEARVHIKPNEIEAIKRLRKRIEEVYNL